MSFGRIKGLFLGFLSRQKGLIAFVQLRPYRSPVVNGCLQRGRYVVHPHRGAQVSRDGDEFTIGF